ncbi:MAG: molecular chaperone HtpG [Bacteroidales bacterium]|nr:molecular chaperone HtpG [Bacteroidales bacterium]MBQ8461682.1 molecular chaperone HtpG [Bacteroidales bacterium]MCR5363413.1 molecular chaperone HtpG [Bacteroidales bacterium]
MAKTNKGKIGVSTENIFPVIKQFLYSDHEIFLRELVANAVDASQKMKALSVSGDFTGELGDLRVSIVLDEKNKTLSISDNGIGMTAEEVDNYINQIAFSSAGEFLEKYKDKIDSIIGHFGLGFYSAFMVSEKVTIDTLSWKDGAKAVKWSCDGSPEYEMTDGERTQRGTTVTLYMDKDSAEEYGQKGKIRQLLEKYCRFMPVPVVFGKKQEWKDGKYVDTEEDDIINNVAPLWTRQPSELKDEDYLNFYKALYPMHEDPMFWIHLNVDFPFHLTGILYFPKIKERMAIEKNKIQLFCNQMFVTDHVENIVPDFLTLLHGVIDSPDIPLNVSRSYLQSDAAVKKISGYITKKVADRLEEIFKENRAELETKWDNIKLFIEYGMLTDEKFGERALKFALVKDSEGKFFSLDEYKEAVKDAQTDKDGNVIMLYATDLESQYSFINAAKQKGYSVLHLDCELDSHLVNYLETKIEKVRFARVDSDAVDRLIVKEERIRPELSEDDKNDLSEVFKAVLPTGNEYIVEADNLGADAAPVLLTQNEFMRRYREMSALGGGMNFFGSAPASYNVTVNMEHPLVAKIFEQKKALAVPEDKEARKGVMADFGKGSDLVRLVSDLALLSNGMLKGQDLSDFLGRCSKALGEAYLA